MMKYWIYETDTKLRMDVQGTGERGLCRYRLLKHIANRQALEREWAAEMTSLGYRDGDNPDLDRWAVVTEYRDDGRVSAVVVDSKEPGRVVPPAGEYKDFDRYVDRFDTLEAAQEFWKEAQNA